MKTTVFYLIISIFPLLLIADNNPEFSTPSETVFLLKTSICDQVSVNSKSALKSSIKKCIKDFDYKIDSFRIKIKMYLNDRKSFKLEKCGDFRYKCGCEIVPNGEVTGLGQININTGSSTVLCNEIFVPAPGQTLPKGEYVFISDSGSSDPGIKYTVLVIQDVTVSVAREDSKSLQKNINLVNPGEVFKTTTNNSLFFRDKFPDLAGKCQGFIRIDYGNALSLNDSPEHTNRYCRSKVYWAYTFSTLDISDILNNK